MRRGRMWARRVGLGTAGAIVAFVPAVADTAQAPGPLDAAAAWRDTLEAYRVPERLPAGDAELAVLILADPPAAASPPAERQAAAAAIAQRQDELAPVLAQLGAEVTGRYRMLVNGLSVRVPAGRLPAIAALADVEAMVPVTYLAPAALRVEDGGAATLPATPVAAGPALSAPAHIALVDAGIDPSHPWLGGGMGPTSLVLGGADLVQGDPDPTGDGAADAHGTGLAALVLRSPALEGLPPEKVPRLLAYRVVAPEVVDGRTRPLARSDRVLAALERAVDPNQDGDPSDRSDVILVGLAQGFGGAGIDPLARAVRSADHLGAVVVAPAGNDGPTLDARGSIGGPAAAPTVLSVGALGAATGPRTATLSIKVGPAAAALEPLPLMGAEPDGAEAPVVLVPGEEGVAGGNDPAEFRDPEGRSRVQGAIALVGRGGGPLAEKSRNAAGAGAVGLVVWDQNGDGAFPGRGGGAEWPIPVVGIGARQGAALVDALTAQPGLVARIAARPAEPVAGPGVASFSSRGPTARGRLKPDLVAPGVDLTTAHPGRAPDGQPLTTLMTGTSVSAAEVAALALRLRVDRPDLTAVEVRSLLVQAARGIAGAGAVDAGAGLAAPPAARPVAIDPPLVSFARRGEPQRITIALQDTTGQGGRYRLALDTGAGEPLSIGDLIDVAPGVRRGVVFRVAGGREPLAGRVLVFPESGGDPVAWAPLVALPAAPPPEGALGVPQVRVNGGVAEVQVAIGRRAREGDRLSAVTLHDVGFWLVPEAGGEALRVSGEKQRGNWPSGTYRVLVSPRLATGLQIAAGSYRLRVTAVAPGGEPLQSESDVFRLG